LKIQLFFLKCEIGVSIFVDLKQAGIATFPDDDEQGFTSSIYSIGTVKPTKKNLFEVLR